MSALPTQHNTWMPIELCQKLQEMSEYMNSISQMHTDEMRRSVSKAADKLAELADLAHEQFAMVSSLTIASMSCPEIFGHQQQQQQHVPDKKKYNTLQKKANI
jgi:hypothetical protein